MFESFFGLVAAPFGHGLISTNIAAPQLATEMMGKSRFARVQKHGPHSGWVHDREEKNRKLLYEVHFKKGMLHSLDRLTLRGGDGAASSSLSLPLPLPLPEPDSESLGNTNNEMSSYDELVLNKCVLALKMGFHRLKICHQLCNLRHFQNQSLRLRQPRRWI